MTTVGPATTPARSAAATAVRTRSPLPARQPATSAGSTWASRAKSASVGGSRRTPGGSLANGQPSPSAAAHCAAPASATSSAAASKPRSMNGAQLSRTKTARNVFNIRASYADETEAIVNQLVSIGIKNIAVFYQNDGFGKSGLEGITTSLWKHNIKPSAVATVERNSTDVTAAVDIISKAKPQAVIMVTLYKPTAAFVKAMRKAGQSPMFATLSPVGTEQLVLELGPEARGITISQVMPYPWNEIVPLARDYQKLVGNKSGYSYYGIEAYAMARVMVDAIKATGKDPTREKLVSALESTNTNLGGYPVEFNNYEHRGSRFVEMTVIGPGGKTIRALQDKYGVTIDVDAVYFDPTSE